MSRLGQRRSRPASAPEQPIPAGLPADTAQRLAAVELRAIDWLDLSALVDLLFDGRLQAMSSDELLAFHVQERPNAVVTEQEARWNALTGVNRHVGVDPGAVVVTDPLGR
jgi:hypothetical protein